MNLTKLSIRKRIAELKVASNNYKVTTRIKQQDYNKQNDNIMAIDFRINGRAVDTDGVLSMPLTRQFDDMTNPVAIKNSVSKTITIPATPNNNTIFGNIWRLDQITGGLFDASKRVPFVLANDGALVTTGYGGHT